MPDEIFINFPTKDRISLATGVTTLSFLDRIATLPDGTTRALAGSITRENPCNSIFFEFAHDVNVLLTLGDSVRFHGLVPAGTRELSNISFDSCEITTTEATNTLIVASTAPFIGYNSDSSRKTVVPSDVSIIDGAKTNCGTVAAPLIVASTPIYKGVNVVVRTMPTGGTYIALGSSSSQNRRLTTVGASEYVDYVSDLNKIYVITDVGNDGALEFEGA